MFGNSPATPDSSTRDLQSTSTPEAVSHINHSQESMDRPMSQTEMVTVLFHKVESLAGRQGNLESRQGALEDRHVKDSQQFRDTLNNYGQRFSNSSSYLCFHLVRSKNDCS